MDGAPTCSRATQAARACFDQAVQASFASSAALGRGAKSDAVPARASEALAGVEHTRQELGRVAAEPHQSAARVRALEQQLREKDAVLAARVRELEQRASALDSQWTEFMQGIEGTVTDPTHLRAIRDLREAQQRASRDATHADERARALRSALHVLQKAPSDPADAEGLAHERARLRDELRTVNARRAALETELSTTREALREAIAEKSGLGEQVTRAEEATKRYKERLDAAVAAVRQYTEAKDVARETLVHYIHTLGRKWAEETQREATLDETPGLRELADTALPQPQLQPQPEPEPDPQTAKAQPESPQPDAIDLTAFGDGDGDADEDGQQDGDGDGDGQQHRDDGSRGSSSVWGGIGRLLAAGAAVISGTTVAEEERAEAEAEAAAGEGEGEEDQEKDQEKGEEEGDGEGGGVNTRYVYTPARLKACDATGKTCTLEANVNFEQHIRPALEAHFGGGTWQRLNAKEWKDKPDGQLVIVMGDKNVLESKEVANAVRAKYLEGAAQLVTLVAGTDGDGRGERGYVVGHVRRHGGLAHTSPPEPIDTPLDRLEGRTQIALVGSFCRAQDCPNSNFSNTVIPRMKRLLGDQFAFAACSEVKDRIDDEWALLVGGRSEQAARTTFKRGAAKVCTDRAGVTLYVQVKDDVLTLTAL